MNQEHVMKFTLRQMEREQKSKLKAKKTGFKSLGNFLKMRLIGNKSKITVEAGREND